MSRGHASMLLFVAGVAAFALLILTGSPVFLGLLAGCGLGGTVCEGVQQ